MEASWIWVVSSDYPTAALTVKEIYGKHPLFHRAAQALSRVVVLVTFVKVNSYEWPDTTFPSRTLLKAVHWLFLVLWSVQAYNMICRSSKNYQTILLLSPVDTGQLSWSGGLQPVIFWHYSVRATSQQTGSFIGSGIFLSPAELVAIFKVFPPWVLLV